MPKPPVSLAEHILLHVLAVVFTFSSILAAFLGYGIYQNGTQSYNRFNGTSISQARIADGSFYQDDFVGGASSDIYIIPWSSGGLDWTKYSSGTDLDTYLDSGRTRLKSITAGAEFISSIFDNGTQERSYYLGGSFEGTMYVRGGDTISALNSSSWLPRQTNGDQYACIPYRYVQLRIVFSAADQTVDMLSLNARPQVILQGIVKDANTGNAISNTNVIATGADSTTSSQSGEYYLSWEYKYGDPTSYSITASKSGYASQTKSVSMSTCDFYQTFDFSLTKTSQSGSSGPSSISGNSSNGGTPSEVSLADFQKTQLPASFKEPGSATTDLSKVADPKKVEGFTLDVPNKNKIVFEDSLDLSSVATINALKDLSKYVKIDRVGTIQIDSKALPALNKKAKLTMASLMYVFTPEILVDGNLDSKNVVSNPSYNKTTGTLVFDVAHFSTFTAVPKVELISSNLVKVASTILKLRISDPAALVSGSLNGVTLAKIKPDKTTGEFTLDKLVFKSGSNELKLQVTSSTGVVYTKVLSINYSPTSLSETKTGTNYTLILVILAVALLSILIVGVLAIRFRKRKEAQAKNATVPPTPSQPAQNLP